MKIPFDRPALTGDELKYIDDVNQKRIHIGQGEYSARCETWLSERYAGKKVMLTFSGTTALEAVFSLLELKADSEVILPSYTFPSCANAIIRAGGIPVLADIEEETLGLDPGSANACVTSRTRAILAVHYAGLSCKIEELREIANRHGIPLIEDSAQAFLSEKNGNRLGNFGAMSILSFGSKKIIHCGQGGALIINDESYHEAAVILRDRGTNREDFFSGRTKAYSWQSAGTSFSPSELNSAFLWAQLNAAEQIIAGTNRIFSRYGAKLVRLEEAGFCRLPRVAPGVYHNGSLFYLLTPDMIQRDRLIAFLGEKGITAQFHFVPLHLGDGKRFTNMPVPLDVSSSVYERLVRLPVYHGMHDDEIDFVCEQIFRYFRQKS